MNDLNGTFDFLLTQSNLHLAKIAKEVLADKQHIGRCYDRGLYSDVEVMRYFSKCNWHLSTIDQLIACRFA
jgi:hypothetical protein